jgi:hypothetical protein
MIPAIPALEMQINKWGKAFINELNFQVEEDEGATAVAGPAGGARGRPKRSRRAAPARGNKERTKSESEHLNDEDINSDDN